MCRHYEALSRAVLLLCASHTIPAVHMQGLLGCARLAGFRDGDGCLSCRVCQHLIGGISCVRCCIPWLSVVQCQRGRGVYCGLCGGLSLGGCRAGSSPQSVLAGVSRARWSRV